MDFYFLPVIYKKRKKRCMLIWKSILTWMHSIRNMQRFSVHFFASILIAIFSRCHFIVEFFFAIFRSNIRSFFCKINDTKEKNVWKLSSRFIDFPKTEEERKVLEEKIYQISYLSWKMFICIIHFLLCSEGNLTRFFCFFV